MPNESHPQEIIFDSQRHTDYETLVNLGRKSLRDALGIEDALGNNAAFERYQEAKTYFNMSFGYEPTYTSVSIDDPEDEINDAWSDPIVLIQYATCLARMAMSPKLEPYHDTHQYSVNAIRTSNSCGDNWSYSRRENFKRIAKDSANIALNMIMDADKAEELTVAANKLAASGIEQGNTQAVLSLIEGAKDAAERSDMPEEVMEELNDFVDHLNPSTGAHMTIKAIEELENLSDLSPLAMAA
jgi:hypothetical protein